MLFKYRLIVIGMLFPLIASAYDAKIDGLYYNFNSNTKQAEIAGNPGAYSGDVIIPSHVTYEGVVYEVTSIGSYAFRYCRDVSSLSIPNSVTRIGELFL